jgi:hypothetical protein
LTAAAAERETERDRERERKRERERERKRERAVNTDSLIETCRLMLLNDNTHLRTEALAGS